MSVESTTDLPGPTRLGEMLRSWRQRAVLTQEELAERSGVSVSTIAGIESGRTRRPRGSSVRLLADALGLSGDQWRELLAAANGEPVDAAVAAEPGDPVPAQLPSDVAGFAGRATDLAQLDTLLPGGDGSAGPVVIAAIVGSAGVGKTALAVRWAHRVRHRFPEGQLYVDLRGYSPGVPLAPLEVLARFLSALGLPGERVPLGLDEAAASYRSRLAGKRVLVVLDNAAGVEQVRPLLPGAAGCLVLVTSRTQLGGLVARDGARWLSLDVLPAGDATALLVHALGADRVRTELAAAAELARLCGHLPLALRVAAANLATRPRYAIAAYVAQLRDQDRLAELAVDGDPGGTVAAAFGLSYERLPGPARRMFRLLGLVPGPDLTVHAAASLVDAPRPVAADLLRTLTQAHLLDEPVAGRYTCHDLLRHYAADRAKHEEDVADRDAARGRVLHWYLCAAQAAADILYPEMLRLPDPGAAGSGTAGSGAAGSGTAGSGTSGSGTSGSGTSGSGPVATGDLPDTLDGPGGAQAWLEAERSNLASAITTAAKDGPRPVAWRLAHALRGFWWTSGRLADWLAAVRVADAAARRDGDLPGQAAAQLSLGGVRHRQGRHREAQQHYAAAGELAGQAGWTEGQASALINSALSHWQVGRLDLAAAGFTEALRLDRQAGRVGHEAITLNNLGAVYHSLGQLEPARRCFTDSLARYRELDPLGRTDASALNNLGVALRDLGRLDEARNHLVEALSLCRELGNRTDEANALDTLATVEIDTGRYAEAREAALAAARLAIELGDRILEASTHTTLGSVYRCAGQPQQALADHLRALELARQASVADSEIRAQLGLAAAHHDLGHHDRAVGHASQALDLARERGYRLREGQAMTALAEIHLGRHDHSGARQYADPALTNHQHTGHRLGQARTHLVLGHLEDQAGDPGAAQDHWRQAQRLFADLGAAETEYRYLPDSC